MAPRSRRSAAAATEVVEEEEQEQEVEEPQVEGDGLKKLRFKQPLVGKPGKQISVGDLLTRLKTLLDELRTIDQEEAHRDSLMPVAQELASRPIPPPS
jgi:sister-chromatid-cohesion protein PDS5